MFRQAKIINETIRVCTSAKAMEFSFSDQVPVTIPTAASPQQLQSLRQHLHAQGLIREAKKSCSATLGKKGSMSFAEVQQQLLQSCILMNTALDDLQKQPMQLPLRDRTTITRHQIRTLVHDVLQYSDSAA